MLLERRWRVKREVEGQEGGGRSRGGWRVKRGVEGKETSVESH